MQTYLKTCARNVKGLPELSLFTLQFLQSALDRLVFLRATIALHNPTILLPPPALQSVSLMVQWTPAELMFIKLTGV